MRVGDLLIVTKVNGVFRLESVVVFIDVIPKRDFSLVVLFCPGEGKLRHCGLKHFAELFKLAERRP